MQHSEYNGGASVVSHQASARPDANAIVFDGREISYAALDGRSTKVAARLAAAGMPKGARVGLLAKNSDRYIEILFGIMKAGAVATTINWRLAGEEVAYIVADAEMSFVFVENEFEPLLEVASQKNQFTRLTIDEGPDDDYLKWLGGADRSPAPLTGDDDVILQMYTSGTTGRPKGAMLTNRNFTKFCDLDSDRYPGWWQVHPNDVSLVVLPLFHIGGLEAVLRVMFSGGTIILHREFDPTEVLQSIARYRPSIVSLVPTALQMVLRAEGADSIDFSCIRNFFYGAAPIALDLLREAVATMSCNFVQCYGLTEATSSVIALPPEDHDPHGSPRMRAAGRPLPGVEVRVVDGENIDVLDGEVGEILIRGAMVMKGYWKLPEATAETIDGEGWLHTGDAGLMDGDGYVYIHDRVKDMIISGGENIYPAEVESAVYGHPAVAEVAVIGLPDAKWGELVRGVVVMKPGAVFDEAELVAWTRTRIASYKAPRSFTVVDALPKNATGKLLKTELRRMFADGAVS